MSNAQRKLKVLITGVNGFIGSNIAQSLQTEYTTIGLDTDSVDRNGFSDFYIQMILPNADIEGLFKTFEPDVCIHCAGFASVSYSVENPANDFASGPPVVLNLADAIRKQCPQCRILFISSAAVYGNPETMPVTEKCAIAPVSPYGYHKAMSETILKEYYTLYNVKSISLRVFSCYGRGLRKQLLWDIAKKIESDSLTLFGTGDESRDFIHIQDLIGAIRCVITNRAIEFDVFNVGTGMQSTVKSVVGQMADCLNYDTNKISFSMQSLKGYPVAWQADITKLQTIGFKPRVLLDNGIADYCTWFLSLKERAV
jgi:UDP-glucose 4-epimerase